MKKQKTNRELENENIRGKKRYLERIAEEREADQEIETFLEDTEIEDSTNVSRANRLDGQ